MTKSSILLFLALLIWMPTLALAHKPSDSYLRLSYQEDSIQFTWDIALRDLEYTVGLDSNHDRAITWKEVRSKQAAILAFARAGLSLQSRDQACHVTLKDQLKIDTHSDGSYVVLEGTLTCETPAAATLSYALFFDVDADHRGITSIQRNGRTIPHIFSPDAPDLQLYDAEPQADSPMIGYLVIRGMKHIWNGFDHVLFLVVLLLPSVLTASSGFEEAVDSFRPAFIKMLTVITAFTIAHCLTLSLVAFELVQLPSAFIEGVVALTILLTAVNNLLGLIRESFWIVCGLFGLIHGFAFASVLIDLRLPLSELVGALFGFNIGVELGQLLIVLAVFPLCYLLRKTPFYHSFIFTGGSALVAAISFLWTIERFFNVQLLVW